MLNRYFLLIILLGFIATTCFATTINFKITTKWGTSHYAVPNFRVSSSTMSGTTTFKTTVTKLYNWHKNEFGKTIANEFLADAKLDTIPADLYHSYQQVSYGGYSYSHCAPTINSTIFTIICPTN